MFPFNTEAKFLGLKPSSNPDYSNLLFVIPETYKSVTIGIDQQSEPNCKILVKASEIPNLPPLPAIGEKVKVTLGVSLSPPKGNYSASLRWDLVKIHSAVAAPAR